MGIFNSKARISFQNLSFQPPLKNDIVSKQFLSLNSKIRKDHQTKNKKLKKNITICNVKKTFHPTLKNLLNQGEKKKKKKTFKYWKQYILNFLKKYQTKYAWASNMINQIQREPFLSEWGYLSDFFNQEMDIIYKPTCLSNLVNEESNKESINDQYQDDKNERNHTQNTMQMLYNLSDNFGESFVVEANLPREYTSTELDYKMQRETVKKYINIFKSHIFQHDHPINLLANFFTVEMTNVIKNIIQVLNANEAQLKSLIEQIQKFILKLQKTLKFMYARTLDYKNFMQEKDEFVNIIVALVFKSNNFYDIVFALYRKMLAKKIKDLDKRIKKFQDKLPNELGVQSKFSLDEKTKEYMIELISKELGKVSNDEEKIEKLKNEIDRIKTYSNENEGVAINEIKKGVNNPPYHSAIHTLRVLPQCSVPFQKMCLISGLSQGITNAINDYWKDLEYLIPLNFLSIVSDDLISLMMYLIIQQGNPEIIIDLQMVKDFTTENTKGTMLGYYYTILSSSILYIKKFEDEEEGEKEENNSRTFSSPMFSSL